MWKKKRIWAALLALLLLLSGCIQEAHSALSDGTWDGMNECHLPDDSMPAYYVPPHRDGNAPEFAGSWVVTNFSWSFSWPNHTLGDGYVMVSLPALDPRVKAADGYNREVEAYAKKLLSKIKGWAESKETTDLESVSFKTEISNGQLTIKILERFEDRIEAVHIARFDIGTQERIP